MMRIGTCMWISFKMYRMYFTFIGLSIASFTDWAWYMACPNALSSCRVNIRHNLSQSANNLLASLVWKIILKWNQQNYMSNLFGHLSFFSSPYLLNCMITSAQNHTHRESNFWKWCGKIKFEVWAFIVQIPNIFLVH